MINSCLLQEAIWSQLLTETAYAVALILKGILRDVHAKQQHQCLASVKDFLLAKLKNEEAEKQEQAVMPLAKQKHETAWGKKEMEQIAFQELEKDHRNLVAAATLDGSELMDNRSLFSHNSSELNLFKDRNQKLVQDWVSLFPNGNSLNAASEGTFSRPKSGSVDHLVQDTTISNHSEAQVMLPLH